jgi:hypothetical protein
MELGEPSRRVTQVLAPNAVPSDLVDLVPSGETDEVEMASPLFTTLRSLTHSQATFHHVWMGSAP